VGPPVKSIRETGYPSSSMSIIVTPSLFTLPILPDPLAASPISTYSPVSVVLLQYLKGRSLTLYSIMYQRKRTAEEAFDSSANTAEHGHLIFNELDGVWKRMRHFTEDGSGEINLLK